MTHADTSLVPAHISTKAEFWVHVRDQLKIILVGQRHWVTNLANASSLVYNALRAFDPHFGNGDRAVNWCVAVAALPYHRYRRFIYIDDADDQVSLKRTSTPSDAMLAGFYLVPSLFPTPHFAGVSSMDGSTNNDDLLLLGPFCGKPACQLIRISPDRPRGVCAGAFLQRKTLVIHDVDAYPAHIACDGETKSEIVCPLILRRQHDEVVLGVLDLDCLVLGGFDDQDKLGLEAIADLLVNHCDW